MAHSHPAWSPLFWISMMAFPGVYGEDCEEDARGNQERVQSRREAPTFLLPFGNGDLFEGFLLETTN